MEDVMTFLKKSAASGLLFILTVNGAFPCVSSVKEARSFSRFSKMVQEEPKNFAKIDMIAVAKNFNRLATIKDVNVEALRGDYFEPREFWGQEPENIFDALYPTLLKHNVPYVLCRPMNVGCMVSNWEKEFPKIELSLEKSVLEQINLFMSKRGIGNLNSETFYASLMRGRENGDVVDRNYLTHKERRIPATPLLTYFEGYYVFKRDGFHGSKYAELATKK